jgi:hypothetical protein
LHLYLMRYIVFVFCFFMAAHSYAQVELLGSFVTGFRGMGSERITFVGKDSFYFDAFYCAEIVRGKGRCEVRDNMLYLFFEKGSEDDFARLPVIQMCNNNDGVTGLSITCVNEKAKPMDFVSIELVRTNGIKTKLYTDSLGKAYWKIAGTDLPLQIITSMVGYEGQKLRIDSLSDYKILIKFDEYAGRKVNKGEVWFYEIDALSEDLILMKPAKSTEDFRRYTKKKYNENLR